MQLDERTRERVDRIFAHYDGADTPGAALAVVQNGEVVYARGYGMANLEYGVPITPDTIFHVASVSKQFTAMAVMLLAQEGLVSLEEDIHAYLPELPHFGHRITLRHLLHHTSGMRDQWELLVAAGWRMDDVITKEQILKLVGRQRDLNFIPGDEYLYSNTGFTLAAEIVQRVSGQSLREFCAERIFAPLDMRQTHFHDDHEEIVPGRAYSYAPRSDGGWRKSVLSYATVGATSLFTTVLDLTKWLRNFDRLAVGNAELLQQMQTPFTLNNGKLTAYGLGLMVETYRDLCEVGHSGADAGFRAWCGRFPERDLGVIVCSNVACSIPRDLARQVAQVLLPELAVSPVAEALPAAGEYAGNYLLLTDGTPIALKQNGGHLLLAWKGKEDISLEPAGVDAWACPEEELRVVGQRDGDGHLIGFALQSPRMNLGVRRLPDYRLAASDLDDYSGRYYSRELDITYQLLVRDGQLLVCCLQHQDLSLFPAGPDTFIGGRARAGVVKFTRDDDGRLTGMLWSGNRVRGLHFQLQ